MDNMNNMDWNMFKDESRDRLPSRFRKPHPNTILIDFCVSLIVVDVWREKNIDVKQYSWFKPDR